MGLAQMLAANRRQHSTSTQSTPDFSTINGRVQYAFGLLFSLKAGDSESNIAKAIRMLWPHVSRDLGSMDPAALVGISTFMRNILNACLLEDEEAFAAAMVAMQQDLAGPPQEAAEIIDSTANAV